MKFGWEDQKFCLAVLFVTPNNILNRTLDRRSLAQGGGQGCIYISLILLVHIDPTTVF